MMTSHLTLFQLLLRHSRNTPESGEALGLEDVSPGREEPLEGMPHLDKSPVTRPTVGSWLLTVSQELVGDLLEFEENLPGQRAALQDVAQLEPAGVESEEDVGAGVDVVVVAVESAPLQSLIIPQLPTSPPQCLRPLPHHSQPQSRLICRPPYRLVEVEVEDDQAGTEQNHQDPVLDSSLQQDLIIGSHTKSVSLSLSLPPSPAQPSASKTNNVPSPGGGGGGTIVPVTMSRIFIR